MAQSATAYRRHVPCSLERHAALNCLLVSVKTLALDLATTTGHALMAGGVLTSGSACFKKKPKEPTGVQFIWFEAWLKERFRLDKPENVAFEEVYRWMSSGAAHMFCGFRAILLKECVRAGVPVFGYSPAHIKKFWTGKGTANKDTMIATTLMRFPDLDLADDNEADAIAILHLHLNQTQ